MTALGSLTLGTNGASLALEGLVETIEKRMMFPCSIQMPSSLWSHLPSVQLELVPTPTGVLESNSA